MKKLGISILLVSTVILAFMNVSETAAKKEEIVVGAPFPLDFLYGWTPHKAMQIAIDEINASGGVNVAGKKMPFKVIYINSKDLEPTATIEGVLAKVEDLIVNRKPDFLMGGPTRSEIGVAALDLIRKHKIVHILTTGVLTPAYHNKIASNYDKYKYGFRITSHGGVIANDFLSVVKQIREQYRLNKVFLMLQTVEHAQKGGSIMKLSLIHI